MNYVFFAFKAIRFISYGNSYVLQILSDNHHNKSLTSYINKTMINMRDFRNTDLD